MHKKLINFLLCCLLLISPAAAFSDMELKEITIDKWFGYLNKHEKYQACSLWNKSFYKNNLFSRGTMMLINRDPNGSFEGLVSDCIEIIDNSETLAETLGVPRNSNQKAADFLYKVFEKMGIVYISKSIWEN